MAVDEKGEEGRPGSKKNDLPAWSQNTAPDSNRETDATPRDQGSHDADGLHLTPRQEAGLEAGFGRQTSQTSSFASTFSSSDSSLDVSDYETKDEEDRHNDGHRPTSLEMRLATLRSRRSYESARRRGEQYPVTPPTADDLNLVRTSSRSSARARIRLSRWRAKAMTPKFTHPLGDQPTGTEVFVDFEGPDDPYRPVNWPIRKKVITTLVYGFITMSATWASASYSAGTDLVSREFNVGRQVAVLGTSLFLMGFGVGPLLWAPLSEVYGRRIAVMAPMFVSICLVFGSAVAKDFQTLMLTRFWSAFFCSAPVTNTGGVLGDLYSAEYRAIGIAGYALAVVGGPALGPIVSTAVAVQPSLGWRWTLYLTGILQSFVLLIGLLFIDETYPPILLVRKARRLRHGTGNWALHAKFEEWDVSIKDLVRKFLVRPIQLLFTPICLLMCLYASFCYGILYMQLGGIPIIFGDVRGWKPLPAALPFLCIMLGAFLGAAANTYNQFIYNKAYHAAGNRPVPERRLLPMMPGSFLFSGGQFLMGWTADPSFHWICPCIGLVMMGTGFFMIFQAALNYLVDTFTAYSASAVGANTFLRSCFGAAFPLVVGPLYGNLGVGPGSSITGGFAALLIPVPFVFFVWGKEIRRRGKWSKASVYD